MIRSRPLVLAGALGSLVIHTFLLAVLANLPMWDVPPSTPIADTVNRASNSLGRGFPGRSNNGPGGRVPGNSARAKAGQADLEATPDEPIRVTAPRGPAAQTMAVTLMPVLDYRSWSSARVTRHLVESTLLALVVFLLALLLRRSSARIRYGLWLAASMKFFVPFPALVGLGAAIGRIVPPIVDLGRAFALSTSDSLWVSNSVVTSAAGPSLEAAPQLVLGLGTLAAAVWIIGSITMAVMRYRLWGRVQAALHASASLTLADIEIPSGVELRSAPGVLEPGVIGWKRPSCCCRTASWSV